jgi:P-type Cu2+ transporter
MRQNLGWAIGYNAIALPIAACVFEPAFGLVLRPEIAALSMSGSSLLVAVNALLLKRLRLLRPSKLTQSRQRQLGLPRLSAGAGAVINNQSPTISHAGINQDRPAVHHQK